LDLAVPLPRQVEAEADPTKNPRFAPDWPPSVACRQGSSMPEMVSAHCQGARSPSLTLVQRPSHNEPGGGDSQCNRHVGRLAVCSGAESARPVAASSSPITSIRTGDPTRVKESSEQMRTDLRVAFT